MSTKLETVQLFELFKPYLGCEFTTLIDGTTSLINLLISPAGQDTIKTISTYFLARGDKGKIITFDTPRGQVRLALGSAFILFLVLILLIIGSMLLVSLYPNLSEFEKTGRT